MIYDSGSAWHAAAERRVMLFGMSGLGKTHVASMLRRSGTWFHYSVDHRIGTRYLAEPMDDELARLAMQVPRLRPLVKSGAVRIAARLTVDDLSALSAWMGKPGDPERGGLHWDEYRVRQRLHRAAEISAMEDSAAFIARARDLFGLTDFVCDTSGSICEVVDPHDPDDPLLDRLSAMMLPVWIRGTEAHTDELVRRFDAAPKPMYYQPAFLEAAWDAYCAAHSGPVDPDGFVRWTYARALAHRQPRYAAMARRGVTVEADEVAALTCPDDFARLIAVAIDRKTD